MRRLLISLSAVSLLAACSGGGDDTTPPATPSITLTSDQSSGTIAKGASSNATLTLGRVNGYGGNVNFTAEGAPTGVTVTFTPATLSGAANTSTATIAVGASATPGNSTLTFRATGSGVTDKTVTYALTIPTPAITVTAGTGAASTAQGTSTTVPITITRTNGAAGPVNLTATGMPTGVTATFNPASIADGATTSTLTLDVASTVATGQYPIVVRANNATAGVTEQTSTVQLTVTAAAVAGYTLTAAPAALSVGAGQPGTSTMTIARTGGFAGNVTLVLEGAPAGVTGTFTPNPATSAANTSVLALTTTAAVAPGTYNLTVRGTATGLADRTTTVALTITAPPGITVTLAPAAVSIAQGGTGTSQVTLARVGGVTGDIAMTATSAQAGITVAFAPTPVTGTNTASTATVTVASNVPAGTYNVTITGTGANNVVGTATLAVTVTTPGGFTMTATNASVTVGGTGTSTVTINRVGSFAGAVALTATGLPANVTATFNPASVTGTTSTVTFTAAANATPGTSSVTINGTGTGAPNASTNITLTVTASGGGGGNVNWRFCDATRLPLFFAYRNGSTGTFNAVTMGANNTFSFTLTGATGQVAVVLPRAGGGTDGQLYLNTTAELQSIASAECTNFNGTPTKSLTGTVAGLAALQFGGVSVGGASTTINGPATTYSLTNVPDRVTDLMAARSALNATTFSITPDRGVLRRNVNYPANSAIPLIDFGGAESFALITATATIGNAGADQVSLLQTFVTGNGASGTINIAQPTGGTATIYGVPNNLVQAGDLHLVLVGASNTGATSIRNMAQYNQQLANRTYTLGNELNLPTVTTTATAPYARIKVAGTWQAEYPDAGASSMTQGTRAWTISSSRGYFGTGATGYEFELPDFTGTTGWQNVWGFITGSAINISTNFTAYTVGIGGVLSEGYTFKGAARTQTQTP